MNNIVTNTDFEKAAFLHMQIMENGRTAAQALFEMCKNLKQMKDERLYVYLGFEDFETYCIEKANIKQTQAYNYIRIYENLGKNFIEEHATFGITKLELLTHVPALEREEFVESNAVEDLTVQELKKQISELETVANKNAEQITLLKEEKSQLEKENLDIVDKHNEALGKIEELESQPVDVAVSAPSEKELAKITKAAEKKAKSEYDKKLKELEMAMQNGKSAAESRAMELEKQLQLAEGKSDEYRIKFQFCLSSAQESLNKLFKVLDNAQNKNEFNKYHKALEKFVKVVSNEVAEKYRHFHFDEEDESDD